MESSNSTNRKKITIEIENLTEAQALALEELMAT